MNAAQRRDWLDAVSECFPQLNLASLSALLLGLDGIADGGVWEGGVCSRPDGKILAVRYFGGGSDYSAWKRAAGGILKLELDGGGPPPADGLPWLVLEWDTVAGEPARICAGSGFGGRVFIPREKKSIQIMFRPERYTSKVMEDPGLAKVLADFNALCPIRDLVFQFADGVGKREARPAWALRLKEPLAWPLFVRLDLAGAFAAESAQLSFFLLDRRVAEMGFDAENLWAFFRE